MPSGSHPALNKGEGKCLNFYMTGWSLTQQTWSPP